MLSDRPWLLYGVVWLLCAGWLGVGQPAGAVPPAVVPRSVETGAPVAGPRRIAAYFDHDCLPDYVTGYTTAGGQYLIEVGLSSRQGKTTIRTRGVGFLVQDVNADNLADLLVADGLGGSFTRLENDGCGTFTPRTAAVPPPRSGPASEEAQAAVCLTDRLPPSQPTVLFGRRWVLAPPPFGSCWFVAPLLGVRPALQAAVLSRGPPALA